MTRVFIAFVIAALPLTSYAQRDSTATDRLAAEFSKAYFIAKEKTPADFYTPFYNASRYVLSPGHPLFRKAWPEFTARYPQLPEDSIPGIIADSMFNRFYAGGFWKDEAMLKVKLTRLLTFYTNALCDCMNKHAAALNKNEWPDYNAISIACEKEIVADITFASRLQELARNLSATEKAALQPIIAKYAYQHCPVYNKTLNAPFTSEVYNQYEKYRYETATGLHHALIRLHRARQQDSLLFLFPQYNTYKNEVEKAGPLLLSQTSYMADHTVSNGYITGTRTYYNFMDSTAILLGQVRLRCTFRQLSPLVMEYRYIPAPAIADKEMLEKRAVENERGLPPPPPPKPLKN